MLLFLPEAFHRLLTLAEGTLSTSTHEDPCPSEGKEHLWPRSAPGVGSRVHGPLLLACIATLDVSPKGS